MRAFLILAFVCFVSTGPVHAAGKAKQVVMIVWDGMRPDFISETNTPTLHALRQRGVFFKENHSVFLSSTEVNGTALATGMYPEHSGIIGNSQYNPKADTRRPVNTENLDVIRRVEEHGSYLGAATLASILRGKGLRTAVAGTKPVVFLHDHAERTNADSPVLADTRTLPAGFLGQLTNVLGGQPEVGATKMNRDLWTTRALIGPMWEKGVPAFSVLWLAEPDNVQHKTAPGSKQSLEVIHNSDRALALVIAALKEKGVFDSTDIFVVSDHGFSTIGRNINLIERLSQNGFQAAREFAAKPAKGDLLVIGLGGAALIYVAGHDEPTIERVVNFLQKEDYTGVVLTKKPRAGTFALADAMIDSAQSPDIAVSYRWSAATNLYGAPGQLFVETQSTNVSAANLRGTHVSLSRFDLHNTLVAAGPDFREGFVNETPSGNVDVAPTILHILGVEPPKPLDGRVLFEALNSGDAKAPDVKRNELQARVKLQGGEWTQRLLVNEVNGVRYLEEGNGKFIPSPAAANH